MSIQTGKDVFGLITKSYYQRLLSGDFVTQSARPIHLFIWSITKEERIKKHVKTIQLINRACRIKPLPKFIRITSLRILKKMYLSLVSALLFVINPCTLNFPTDSGVNTHSND